MNLCVSLKEMCGPWRSARLEVPGTSEVPGTWIKPGARPEVPGTWIKPGARPEGAGHLDYRDHTPLGARRLAGSARRPSTPGRR